MEIDKSFFRNMKGHVKIENNKVFVISEFGHKIEVDPKLQWLKIDTVTEYDEPFKKSGAIEWNVITHYKEINSSQVTKSKEEIRKIIMNRDVIPPQLDYDYFHIGFVFPPKGIEDPNKFRWWLDYKKDDKNPYNMFCDELDIEVSVTTESWQDQSGAEYYHGRFKVQKGDVKEIKETEPMKLKILGNAEKRKKNFGSCQGPEEIDTIKIYFDTKKNFWHVVNQNQKKNVLTAKHFKNLAIRQMPMKGIADRSFQKPRVYFEIDYYQINKFEVIGDLLLLN